MFARGVGGVSCYVDFRVDNINSRQQALANSNPRRPQLPMSTDRNLFTYKFARKRPAAWLGNSGRSVNFRATTIPRRFDERRISDGRISSSCLRLMIFEQVRNWSGGINASWLRKLGILLGLFVWINYSNANDIIYIYTQVCTNFG